MSHTNASESPHTLLHKLCGQITGLKDDDISPLYQFALTTVSSSIASSETDEFVLSEKIKKKLARQGREKDAAGFSEILRKLQSNSALQDRTSILCLLLRLADDKSLRQGSKQKVTFNQGLLSLPSSTPHPAGKPRWGATPSSFNSTTDRSAASSGISSIHGTLSSTEPTPQSFAPGFTPAPRKQKGLFRTPGAPVRETTSKDVSSVKGSLGLSSIITQPKNLDEIPESVLLRDMVFIFQGIEGKLIHLDPDRDAFVIDSKVHVRKSTRTFVTKLGECGWLHNKVKKFTNSHNKDRSIGLVAQSFLSALQQELTDYYRLIAVLESQLHQEEVGGHPTLSLRQLVVWTCEPLVRIKALAAMVDVCQGKRGGGLASAIHSYLQHGDPSIQALVKHTLTLVVQPIFSTITRWIYDGELEDAYHEFFVASNPVVKDDRLWHDKYTVRKAMIPSFISPDQANKILLTGKSINFLRQVCKDRTTIRNRDAIKNAETTQGEQERSLRIISVNLISVESIFMQDMLAFPKMIDTVYKETSQHLLEVLHNKYKFMEHLKAMRRYLLLGQGDFIRHLMDLLEDNLARPAASLFMHNLTEILESAIRATNAQFDDSDILKRLDVRLLEVSPEDTGWDVFSLDYHVDGPIRTVFTPECMNIYLRVFNFLWRAKRMEYILAAVFKEQLNNARLLRNMPELCMVLHQGHLICNEMFHFVQQVQYYLNFEVLECAWDELLQKVTEATDLDHIISAHQEFLDNINTRSLLDTQSSKILTQLRTIFDLIIKFEKIQEGLYLAATDELEARERYQKNLKRQEEMGEWGVTGDEEEEEEQRKQEFINAFIPTTRSQLRLLAESYQNMVQQFLVMLMGIPDINLRFLSVRLDFNEHYKAKEPKLRLSLGRKVKPQA
ncbi:hypothetical protein CAPTEDRAFT_224608 [Capitella teleta]|uniref:Uncharacterized protein n=1 Tax=Capitella teleta TaxID=283909 RepID=R7VEL5_CAPTE|nr:hypothetical protein CAPTEDRAFT_224608 [Capitella teleta]|eukprot:ELU14115.1 hypothetical protein CAPTEDRAFT_224608 [Capitella teleta]